MKGYVQVYTGDGKGKTTAALGLALRALGAGLKVYIGQLMKQYPYSEIQALQRLGEGVKLVQFGTGSHVIDTPDPKDVAAAQEGLAALKAAMASGQYDLVIADEANVAFACELIQEQDLLALMAARPPEVELVLTGRGAPPAVMAQADLVTEMKSQKHYYECDVPARTGIER